MKAPTLEGSMNQLSTDNIPFIDVAAQRRRLGPAVDEAVARVLAHCQFINGPEVTALEAALAAFCGAKHVVTCASGTDALVMVLMAKGVGRGDAVLCPSFTFCATGEAVALAGATPVFVDVDEATFNIDASSLKRGIATAKRLGLKPRGVIPVDLFGQSADHDEVFAVAVPEGMFVLDDAAQAFGASYKGRRLGGMGVITATSFFPAKPLGCYGDGGAIFTDDAALAEVMRSIRVHGQGSDKYDNVRLGLTGRLDTIQAAVLLEKMKIFPEEIELRDAVAQRYSKAFRASNRIVVPRVIDGAQSTWAQYTIQVPDRDKLQTALKAKDIPTAVYYPIPLSQQKGYKHFPSAPTPVSEKISKTVVALPMHPYLDEATQDTIIAAVLESVGHA